MTLDDFLRYLGLLLQVLGLGTTALGIADVRRRFTDRPGVLLTARAQARRTGAWLERQRRRLLRRPRRGAAVALSASGTLHASGSLRAYVRPGPLPTDSPLDEQVAALDQRTRNLYEHVNRVEDRLLDEAEQRRAADRATTEQRERADRELRGLVRELAGGGLRLQAWGVVAFLVGEVLAGLDRELAGLLRWAL